MIDRPAVRGVLSALGLVYRSKRWGPCPVCQSARTRADRRPTIITGMYGWRCVSCSATGDAVTIAAIIREGTDQPRGEVYLRVVRYLREIHGGPPRETDLPPNHQDARIDPSPALSLAVPLSRVRDASLVAWLTSRQIDSSAPAGWLPDFWSKWWPGFARHWPVILPACTGRGRIESMHGIAIDTAPRKTTWPKGGQHGGLLFASASTRRWLSGQAPAPQRVVVVEGATDYLTASTELPDCAILGIASGSPPALSTVPKEKGQRWYVATDPDAAGRRYAKQIAEALYPTPVRPFPMVR